MRSLCTESLRMVERSALRKGVDREMNADLWGAGYGCSGCGPRPSNCSAIFSVVLRVQRKPLIGSPATSSHRSSSIRGEDTVAAWKCRIVQTVAHPVLVAASHGPGIEPCRHHGDAMLDA